VSEGGWTGGVVGTEEGEERTQMWGYVVQWRRAWTKGGVQGEEGTPKKKGGCLTKMRGRGRVGGPQRIAHQIHHTTRTEIGRVDVVAATAPARAAAGRAGGVGCRGQGIHVHPCLLFVRRCGVHGGELRPT
jgi:hypothetical protein